jgi:hypothetical protein
MRIDIAWPKYPSIYLFLLPLGLSLLLYLLHGDYTTAVTPFPLRTRPFLFTMHSDVPSSTGIDKLLKDLEELCKTISQRRELYRAVGEAVAMLYGQDLEISWHFNSE